MTQKKVPFAEMSYAEKKKHLAENYEKMKAEESKLVRGKFIYHECPGGMMEFAFRKYKGEEIVKYQMIDGHIYTVPLAVARHLNSNCAYPEYSYIPGDKDQMVQGFDINGGGFQGGASMKITRKVNRVSFQSLEFLDDDFGGSGGIVTVEKVI